MFAVAKRMFEENRTSGSIRDTIDLTLSWAILPGLAEAVTPAIRVRASAPPTSRSRAARCT